MILVIFWKEWKNSLLFDKSPLWRPGALLHDLEWSFSRAVEISPKGNGKEPLIQLFLSFTPPLFFCFEPGFFLIWKRGYQSCRIVFIEERRWAFLFKINTEEGREGGRRKKKKVVVVLVSLLTLEWARQWHKVSSWAPKPCVDSPMRWGQEEEMKERKKDGRRGYIYILYI